MNIDLLSNRLLAFALALADAQVARAKEASGLGASACAVLVTLGAAPGATIADLATIVGVTHSVMVRTVETLLSDGLVERTPVADGRKVSLLLTAEGARRRSEILTAREHAATGALAAVAETDRAALAVALDAMLAAITADRATADHLCRLCDEEGCGADCPVERRAREIEAAQR